MASIVVGSLMVVLVEQGVVPFFGLKPIFPGLLASGLAFVLLCWARPNATRSVELDPA